MHRSFQQGILTFVKKLLISVYPHLQASKLASLTRNHVLATDTDYPHAKLDLQPLKSRLIDLLQGRYKLQGRNTRYKLFNWQSPFSQFWICPCIQRLVCTLSAASCRSLVLYAALSISLVMVVLYPAPFIGLAIETMVILLASVPCALMFARHTQIVCSTLRSALSLMSITTSSQPEY